MQALHGATGHRCGRRAGDLTPASRLANIPTWRNPEPEPLDYEAPVRTAPWIDPGCADSLTRRSLELFEKKNQLRVVMTGHGHRIAGEPKIELPLGMTLYFYVLDGWPLENEIGRAIEGFTGSGQLPKPVETVKSGTPVWNYRLSWWNDLPINASAIEARYTLITIDECHGDRSVPLSILLRDTRCQNAEIHWAACRAVQSRSILRRYGNHAPT